MSNEKPQLFMRRDNFDNLPALQIPEGFTLRSYQEGDKKDWEKIVEETFGYYMDFEKDIKNHVYFKEDKILFICKDEIPVATATAWNYDKEPNTTGYVHMVGAYAANKGLGLGYQVSLAVLYKMKEDGKQQVVLLTDDFRLPAIYIYLKLGFKPDIKSDESYRERWEEIYKLLGLDWNLE